MLRIPLPTDDEKIELEETSEEYTREIEGAYKKIVDAKSLMNSFF